MARRCEETGSSLAQGMSQLIQRIESMPGAGAAHSALQSQSGHLSDGLRRILTALDELAGKIDRGAAHYGARDEDDAAEINRAAQAASHGQGGVYGILHPTA